MKSRSQIEYIKTEKLIPYARNSRIHSETQIQQIAASIKEFGFLSPCIIADDNMIIAGHGRIQGASLLGMKDVPCIKAKHLSEAQRKAYCLVDNRLNETGGGWDKDMLKIEIEELTLELDFDLEPVGFSVEEIESLLRVDDFKPDLPDNDKEPSAMTYKLIIECEDDVSKQALFDELKERGFRIRA
jgi:ParB-like chromosome segregation protein Spo0J